MSSTEPKTIVIIGTLDTKGKEVKYVKDHIENRGHRTVIVDAGVLGEPAFKPDVSREMVAQAGGSDLAHLVAQQDIGAAVQAMLKGAVEIAKRLYAEGQLDGVMSLGGGKGTAIGTAAMRALPLGVPKLAVSTGASGDTRRYIGTKDILMFPSITDIIGLNRVNSRMLLNAVGAMVGMVEARPEDLARGKVVVAMTALGITTAAAMKCMSSLEREGYEVMVFHATGIGGRAMEELIYADVIDGGVMDLTTSELVAELVGSTSGAGPERLEAAGKKGLPQVIGPGGLDVVAFGGRAAIPERYRNRLLYDSTPVLTGMRTNVEENVRVAEVMAAKVNRATGPVAIVIPTRGFSAFDRESGIFQDLEADGAFIAELKGSLKDGIEMILIDAHINDEKYAEEATRVFLEMKQGRGVGRRGAWDADSIQPHADC
jgi:uncharacterized protein (UPF0261 family)